MIGTKTTVESAEPFRHYWVHFVMTSHRDSNVLVQHPSIEKSMRDCGTTNLYSRVSTQSLSHQSSSSRLKQQRCSPSNATVNLAHIDGYSWKVGCPGRVARIYVMTANPFIASPLWRLLALFLSTLSPTFATRSFRTRKRTRRTPKARCL